MCKKFLYVRIHNDYPIKFFRRGKNIFYLLLYFICCFCLYFICIQIQICIQICIQILTLDLLSLDMDTNIFNMSPSGSGGGSSSGGPNNPGGGNNSGGGNNPGG